MLDWFRKLSMWGKVLYLLGWAVLVYGAVAFYQYVQWDVASRAFAP